MDSLEPGLTGGMACYGTFLSMGMEHDYIPTCRERLAGSNFPMPIVYGGQDMVPQSTGCTCMNIFPLEHVQFEIVEDADRFVFDHPRAVEIVKETLARV
jgi:hypothetical protein